MASYHVCVICSKSFAHSSGLYRHIRNVHGEKTAGPYSRCISCCLCNDQPTFRYTSALKKHMAAQHDVTFIVEKLTFQTFEEFTKWKTKTEKETCSKYVQQSGAARHTTFMKKIFYCNRSGHYAGKGSGKRSLKAQGSCKINGYCPSQMIVVRHESNVTDVEYTSTHVGHSQDLKHLTLQPADREWIAAQLKNGIEMNTILKTVKQSVQDKPKRIHLLSRKDLVNVKHAYKIDNGNDKLDSVDSCTEKNIIDSDFLQEEDYDCGDADKVLHSDDEDSAGADVQIQTSSEQFTANMPEELKQEALREKLIKTTELLTLIVRNAKVEHLQDLQNVLEPIADTVNAIAKGSLSRCMVIGPVKAVFK